MAALVLGLSRRAQVLDWGSFGKQASQVKLRWAVQTYGQRLAWQLLESFDKNGI
jgi:hypothetical protein